MATECFVPTKPLTECFKQSRRCSGCLIWNSLLDSVKSVQTQERLHMSKMAFELSFSPVRKWSLSNNIYKGRLIVPFLYYLYHAYISTFLLIMIILLVQVYMSCLLTKLTKWHVRPAKIQIILGIHPVWSESLLCTQWVAKDPSFLHVVSEVSDQTGECPV